MEPLDDDELERLLSAWAAPNAPQSLTKKFSERRLRWWERLVARNPPGKQSRREKRLRKGKRHGNFTG